MRRGSRKHPLSLMLVLVMLMSLYLPGTSYAAPMPELLITEIVPASAGTGQPYEYVEIYNTTNQPIDLHNYRLLYYTASPYTTVANRWPITDKVIPPRTALVLWLKKFDYPNVPLSDFNANYGTDLTPDQVFEVRLTTSAQGLHDSAKRRVAIARQDETVISSAYINDGVADGTGKLNLSITYRYADSSEMQKIANGQPATPGVLVPAQMPPNPEDSVPPSAPTGLTAEAGAGWVALSWTPVSAPDLAGYRVYRDGALHASVPAAQSSLLVEKLAGTTYTFTVSAVNRVGQESDQSAPVTAAPTHEVITQQERSPAYINDKYESFKHISTIGPVIPGLVEDLIPQGAAWWPEREWLLTSNYLGDGRPSVITIVDSKTGLYVKNVRLYQEDGTPYSGHAGGLTVSRDHAWIANAGHLWRIRLADLLAAPDNGNVQFADRFPVETNASYVEYNDGVLWVGEFYHPSAGFNTKPSHHMTNHDGTLYGAWIAGYVVDPATDRPASPTPAYLLSVSNQIQGVAFTADSIVLSRSYGRNNDSHLFRFVRPDLAGAPHQTVTLDGQSVPLWFLDSTTAYGDYAAMVLPPLAEEIVTDGGNRLFVLFESGANEYRHNGAHPFDRWAIVDLAQWSRYGTVSLTGVPGVLKVGEQVPLQVLRHWGNGGDEDLTHLATFTTSHGGGVTIENGVLTATKPGDVRILVQFGEITFEEVRVIIMPAQSQGR